MTSKLSTFIKQNQRNLIEPVKKPFESTYPLSNEGIILNAHRYHLTPLKYKSTEEFISNYKPPSYINRDSVPTQRTDIKGIDASGFRYLLNKNVVNAAPVVINNPYIQVRYFADTHFLSKLRKSNIAVASFNSALSPLNDPVLAKSLKSYNGKYRNHLYFNENRNPLTTAVNRAKIKKLIKQNMVESMKHIQPQHVGSIRGVYFVRYLKYPNTQEDKDILRHSIEKGIRKLFVDKQLRNEITRNTGVGKKPMTDNYLIKGAKQYNTIGEQNIPLYYPKLPFLISKGKKTSS